MSEPPPAGAVSAVAVPGMPEVGVGDDLAALIARAVAGAGLGLLDTDVVVVASKVVAKAEGRSVAAPDAAARDAAIAAQTVRVVAERALPDGRTTRVVQSRSGPVLAAAGVDASDVTPGTVLLLPADADASARALRDRLAELTGAHPAVLVTDTGGRPWRDGVTDFALGAAGFAVLDDVRGRRDSFGRVLEVTVRAVADEVAALADLVKGKSAGTPVAIVRGLDAFVVGDDGPGAAGLVRVGPTDWFAFGHVEAARAALGVVPGVVRGVVRGGAHGTAPAAGRAAAAGVLPIVPIPPIVPDALPARLERAVAVAGAAWPAVHGNGGGGRGVAEDSAAPLVAVDGDRLVVTAPPFAAGAMAERLRVALWAEAVDVEVEATPSGAVVTARLR